MSTYSTYEAKAKLSEILRRVRRGERVRISYHGEEIAEVSPIEREETVERAVERLVGDGVLEPASAPGGRFEPLARRPGALARFLEERE